MHELISLDFYHLITHVCFVSLGDMYHVFTGHYHQAKDNSSPKMNG